MLGFVKSPFSQGHQDPVVGAEFLDGSNDKFVSYGKGHLIFWEYEGGKLNKKTGIFEVSVHTGFNIYI